MPLSTVPITSNNNNNDNNNINLPSVAPYYGTRLSTVLLVRNNGQVLFIERDIWKLGEKGDGVPVKSDPPTERKYVFNIESSAAAAAAEESH